MHPKKTINPSFKFWAYDDRYDLVELRVGGGVGGAVVKSMLKRGLGRCAMQVPYYNHPPKQAKGPTER
eukprot:3841807-Amphidinium_carterae.1